MLQLDNVSNAYGDSQILFGISMEINAGEVVSLLGRNGMGKTTTVASIMGLLPVRSGTILFNQQPIHHLHPYQVARCGIGLVPEGRRVFPTLSVRENLVATATRGVGGRSWSIDRVLELFSGLEPRLNSLAGLLSGGEQQMLAIGRALMTNPRVLILDEATEGLAPLVRKSIWHALTELKKSGLSILVIDKNLESLLHLADRHYILEKGRVVWSGSSTALRAAPEVLNSYLAVAKPGLTVHFR